MKKEQRKSKKETIKWDKYLQEYEKFLKEVRKDTFKNFLQESNALLVPISDSIEFYSGEKKEWSQVPHSFILILKNYLWKLTNWISYEILHGKYFEAMRDTRFLFEGSIYGMVMEDAIEKVIYEKYGGLSRMELKLEIIDLWKRVKNKGVYKKEGVFNKRKEKIKSIVHEYFRGKQLRKMSPEEVLEYIEDYSIILADRRLGLSIPELIEREIGKKNFLEYITSEEKEKFKGIWRSLCEYTHFPGIFFHKLVEEGPALIFVEIFNKNLFEECVRNYLTTLDLFYSVALWRWPDRKTIKRLKNIDKFWKRNLKKIYTQYFTLFPKTLKFCEKEIKTSKAKN
jgi:hypothetical protein